MNNLEKFTAGEVAARNNGTLEQLKEVIGHCFKRHKTLIYGTSKYYYLASWDKLNWDCNETTDLPTIDITQLWEELQALKKPEIWWIRVTEENKETLEKWRGEGYILKVGLLVGLCKDKDKNRITKESNPVYLPKTLSYDFGNEIDFATFLKYTGVEPEKVEKSLEEKISEVKKLIDHRGCLLIQFDVLKDELTEINTKLLELIK